MRESALYRGIIRHRRFSPVDHEFRYRITMPLLNLDTIDREFSVPALLGTRYPGLGWFRRKDYFGDPEVPLKQSVADLVAADTGWRPDGDILLLSHLRYWGFIMNPISIFYCHDRAGLLRALLLQVTNTPWREKVCYVIESDPGRKNQLAHFDKQMHVSPFNPMDMSYRCRYREPTGNLVFHLENHRQGHCETDATLVLERTPMTLSRLTSLVLRQPGMTVKTGLGIYWQALELWRKGAPIYDHPEKSGHINSSCEPSQHGQERPLI